MKKYSLITLFICLLTCIYTTTLAQVNSIACDTIVLNSGQTIFAQILSTSRNELAIDYCNEDRKSIVKIENIVWRA